MNRDRGKKKWAPAAFMPEHTKMLRDMYAEDLKFPIPELAEYEWQEISVRMTNAFEKRLPVNLLL
ncbi:YolD-like family protein [Robertmurraya massiliosenegalensis]|uniref:YolD-like family protein n=1 Tax=Robertmurraya TaxID=2837507 RepID=UPI0039A6E917